MLLVTVATLWRCHEWHPRCRFHAPSLVLMMWKIFMLRQSVTRPRNTRVTNGWPWMEAIYTCQMLSFTLNHCVLCSPFCSFVSQDAIDGTDAWSVFPITDTLFDKAIPNFPRKNGGILLLVLNNLAYDRRSSDLWFASSNWSWTNGTCLIESAQDFADTAMRNQQTARNLARSHPTGCKLHDTVTNVIWERSTVYKGSSKLINPSMTLKKKRRCRRKIYKENKDKVLICQISN